MRPVHRLGTQLTLAALAVLLLVTFTNERRAEAVPSFARKYQTSCLTCHTVYPVLNPFGEAFRRNGYRFPSQKGSVDSDAVKASMVALGQEEYKKSFPNSVWPSSIPDAVPLSIMFNGAATMNVPGSDAQKQAGNVFTWGGLLGELHIFGAGSLSDTLTYFSQVTIAQDGSSGANVDIETAYLLWNDIVGPDHAVNLYIGRLFAPQLSSFGLHSDYLTDTRQPGVSVVGLFNPSGSFVLGQGHTDGIEASGILFHRLGWSAGWVASTNGAGFNNINAEDAYVHIGVKSGGVALDGEGKYGSNVPDATKPWAEKSITVDVFGYHGLNVLDNASGPVPGGSGTAVQQRDAFNAIGATARGQLDSFQLDVGAQFEWHNQPMQAAPATVPAGAPAGTTLPGIPNYQGAQGLVTFGELDYVIFPWLVPGVRAEYTVGYAPSAGSLPSSNFSLLRVIPGVAMLVRPDVRVLITGDLETAKGVPTTGAWGAAGGITQPLPTGAQTTFQAETITATANVAF